MERWVGKTAIVTGASSGIGAAITEALVESGVVVVGLARRKEKIDELREKLKDKMGKLYALKADVSKEADILKSFQWVKDNLGAVHILVNNAGCAAGEKLLETDTEIWRKIMDTNFLGYSIAAREAVKSMHKNNIDGHIIYVSSIASNRIIPVPNINLYPASKFAVRGFQETLKVELVSMGSKIKQTGIYPGVVDTEIWAKGGFTKIKGYSEALQQFPKLRSEDVVDSVIYALSTPPHVQVPHLEIQAVGEIY